MRYYIYKTNDVTGITKYLDRRAGNWSKWFDKNCYYPTLRGVKRVYKMRVKYITANETIGWDSLQTVKREEVTNVVCCDG